MGNNTILLRISLLGDAAVGKTSLIKRFANGTFTVKQQPTFCDISNVRFQVEADVIELRLSDNCGIEKFNQMARSYNQRADCLILVYDVTCRSSFENLDSWLESIKENCDERVQVIVVGNKLDLLSCKERQISNEDIANYAQTNEAVFMETSALDNYNINEVFYRAVKLILKAQGLLLPGCEEDLFMRQLSSEIHEVPEPERTLKKVVVKRAADADTVVVKSIPIPTKPQNTGCC